MKTPTASLLNEDDDILMATTEFGRGTVCAFVDPWLNSVYTDGWKLPVEYENYAGGVELVLWLLQQVPR